ncbi:MAG TPA: DUF5060 domain-containing protein, partial [Sedimentisphaerales bacterium]|nr:DUF5060 domain-containing protein [Sedimentisphaerales bacterium]
MVRRNVLIFDLILLALICPCCRSAQDGRSRSLGSSLLDVEHSHNTNTVPKYEVFELTFKHENKYQKPFFDVNVEVIFTSPSKKQIRVGGFHYGSSSGADIHTRKIETDRGQRQQVTYDFDKQDLWKAR